MRERLSLSRAVSLLVAVISIGLVAACSTSSDPTAAPAAATSDPWGGTPSPEPVGPSASPVADELRLPTAHVHAIARDPGSGSVVVAAHDGLYVYDGAIPERVGPVIDLRGFTVAAPGHYYASGHPGTATDLPQPVGLIESRDGGNTWTVLSRGGRSDFHSLTTAGSTVVGFDGVLRSTPDGRTWTDGNLDAEPRTLAGSRNGPTVLATTPQGLMHSTDAGVSWRWRDQAPRLLMASFGDGDAVAGLTPDGQAHISTDAGLTWQATQLLAPDAQALYVSGAGDDLEILVAAEKTVVASTGGRPFETLTSGTS